MMYNEIRTYLVEIVQDMLKYGLLNIGGGAIGYRCNENHILITTTGSAFRRWKITEKDFIVADNNGKIVEQTGNLGATGVPIILDIFREIPNCNAIVHSHAEYSHALASIKMSIPHNCHLLDTLGEVPCLVTDDFKIKNDFLKNPTSVEIPDAMVQRKDVADVYINHILPQIKTLIYPRKEELQRHGLAFTLYRHGVYVLARNIDEAVENLNRVESSARAFIYSSIVNNAK